MTLQHGTMLKPSGDWALFGEAVESRFLDLCGSWQRVKGVDLPIPESLNADMMRWREMRVRHRTGDFRHTEAELKSTKVVAQWTLDRNAELRHQVPQKLECLEV